MRRTPVLLFVVLCCPLVCLGIWRSSLGRAAPTKARDEDAARPGHVPLTQVVLFNTGVGYFQREGAVEGSPRVDLSFPVTDINDLLKSLTVEDGGKPGVITYEGADPGDVALNSFTLNLSGNPTFGQLLNQARGERIEVSLDGGAAGNGVFSGVVVGMEAQQDAGTRETHHLNLLTSDGVRRLPLERIQRLRFLNASIEEEFRRALGMLAASNNTQRRNLSFHLRGEGKRKLKVGYVVDTPVWKSTYRLSLGGKDAKPALQTWAIVQNTTEEDWKDVRLALVSGRPISFKMDLAQALFVPRPSVTPEVYTSLQPPTFQPASRAQGFGGQIGMTGGFNVGGGFGQFGQYGGGQLGVQSGSEDGKPATGGGINWAGIMNRYQFDLEKRQVPTRLSYEELRTRQKAARAQATQAAAHRTSDVTADSLAVDIGTIGEGFRLTLDQSVSLPRQKSALLPIQGGPITLTRMSIYNRTVHPRFPLLGAKVKNTTGQHLVQGPVAVFDEGDYVGDCKLPNLQPNEERLVSYAMDLGLEVRHERIPSERTVEEIRLQKEWLTKKYKVIGGTKYRLHNRSALPRRLLLDHPETAEWTVVGKNRPVESAKGIHRFEWKVDAAKITEEVVSEQTFSTENISLRHLSMENLRAYVASNQVSKAIQQALTRVVAFRVRSQAATAEVYKTNEKLRTATKEQDRVRANMVRIPVGSAARKRNFDRFDELEVQIEKLGATLREQRDAVDVIEREFAEYVSDLDLR